MTRELKVPARRSLLDQPQRLGVLPTMWFWNNWQAQRLILPFVLITAPALLLLNVLQLWLRFDAWVLIAVNLVIPFLTMGLVERHVRAQARLRFVKKEIADPPRPVAYDGRAGRALLISMAGVSGVLTVLLLLQVSPTLLGAAVVCGGVLIATNLRDRSRARRLASGEKSGIRGLPECEQEEQ